MAEVRAALSLVLLLVVAACSDGGPGGTVVMTPAQARRLVDEYGEKGNRANASLDVNLQRQLESGPAEAIDIAYFERLKAEGKSGTGGAFTFSDAEVYVPRQAAPPAYFLSRYTVRSGNRPPSRQFAVFAQDSAGAPWEVSVFVNLAPTGVLPDLAVDGGYTAVVGPGDEARWKFSPSVLGRELASYLGGSAGSSVFAPGPATSEVLGNQRRSVDNAAANKLRLTYGFTPSDHAMYHFPTRDKGVLTFFTMQLEERLVADQGGPSLRQDGNRTAFGGLLPPGEYREVRTQYLIPVAAHVPRRGSQQLAEVVGLYQGIVAISGTPATP